MKILFSNWFFLLKNLFFTPHIIEIWDGHPYDLNF